MTTPLMTPMTAFLLLALAGTAVHATAANTGAQTVYRCDDGGRISYQETRCARGKSVALPPPPAGVALDAGPGTGDARTLLALEKLRLAREREARRTEQAERKQARAIRTAAVKRERCTRLRLNVKRAEDDLARIGRLALTRAEQARTEGRAQERLRRQRDTLAARCPA